MRFLAPLEEIVELLFFSLSEMVAGRMNAFPRSFDLQATIRPRGTAFPRQNQIGTNRAIVVALYGRRRYHAEEAEMTLATLSGLLICMHTELFVNPWKQSLGLQAIQPLVKMLAHRFVEHQLQPGTKKDTALDDIQLPYCEKHGPFRA
jgi:hypothetical protein